jgi:hypothetical protein
MTDPFLSLSGAPDLHRAVVASGAAVSCPQVARPLGADGWAEAVGDVAEWFVELARRPWQRRR